VVAGDLNGDFVVDLAVAHPFVNGFVSALVGNGDGSFQAPARFSAGSEPRSIAIADLNVDGRPDLAVANALTNDVSVLPNTTSVSVAAQIAGVSALMESFRPPLPPGLATDLHVKLAEATAQLDKGKTDDACHKLDQFGERVRDETAKRSPGITSGQARVLLDVVARVTAALGCP
jgi:hypothetical protein